MKEHAENPNYMLSSVKTALRIMNAFSADHPEWGIRELSRHLGITHTTVQRILATLASEGYVAKDPRTRKYRLGARLLAFTKVIASSLEVHRESLPVLQQLVQKTGRTAHIGVLEGNNFVYLHKVEPQQSIPAFSDTGLRTPCYCTAEGKAILAYQDEAFIDGVIQAGLYPFTKKTITDPDKLKQNLREIARQGYAITKGEYQKDGRLMAIAAPVYDYTGKVFASLSIIDEVKKVNDELEKYYISLVTKAAKEVSKRLGYYG